jgi:hypothetical protein
MSFEKIDDTTKCAPIGFGKTKNQNNENQKLKALI